LAAGAASLAVVSVGAACAMSRSVGSPEIRISTVPSWLLTW
jgi:hypothetical protein